MSPTLWIIATLACICIQSLYSMLEMATVSLNKVRLQYYASKGMRRARWIEHLLRDPSRLFGTTLVAVNIALQVGSECSREVYMALGLNPDIAPLTQIFLVMIFAELAPMFAARRYAEHVALLGAPIIYATSKVMAPLIWFIGIISRVANRLVGGPKQATLNTLSREELQHVVEAAEPAAAGASAEFNLLVNNIFTFRTKHARDAMTRLATVHMLPIDASIADMRDLLSQYEIPCVPIYSRTRKNIVGIALPLDCLNAPNEAPLRDFVRPPWFITRTTPLMQILKQFRHNNQTIAVVLDHNGLAVGLLALDDLLEEIFGATATFRRRRPARQLIELTLPGEMTVEEFNTEYKTHLSGEPDQTLAELVATTLGHPPTRGDSLYLGEFELTILETTLRGAKSIAVRSLS